MEQTFDDIKKRILEIEATFSIRDERNRAYAAMYWMDDTRKGRTLLGYDKNDIRETKSTASRDAVSGLRRMLATSKPTFSVTGDEAVKDRLEDALDKWWAASCLVKRANIHSDLALDAILFGDACLSVDAIEDMMEYTPTEERPFLETLALETPFLFEVAPAQVSYPVFGRFGMSEFLRKYKLTGRAIQEQWQVEKLDTSTQYVVRDYYNLTHRCVYIEGKDPIIFKPHGLTAIPLFSSVTDGTELFPEEERKRQPFLYGKYMGSLDIRENEILTSLFTSIGARGVGPIYLIDPESVDGEVEVRSQGAFRYILARGQPHDDKAFDGALLQAIAKLDDMGQRTTINSQTLGENIQPGTVFSGYAMAAQTGRIPVVPVQQAIEKVIHAAAMYALRAFRDNGMKWGDLKANDIPKDFKAGQLTVKLEVDLPQDQLRNAQTAAQLKSSGVPLSNEWFHNFLQIRDSGRMTADVLSEQAMMAAAQQDLPMLVQQILQSIQPTPPTPPATPGQPGEMPGGPMPEGAIPPEAMGQNPMMPGGPDAAAAGAPALPATEPMMPGMGGMMGGPGGR